jgi:hypothetical protein
VLFPQTTQPAPYQAAGNPLRLFQNMRLSASWLGGKDSPTEMRINDFFITTTAAFPNFLWSGQPWFVSPGFGVHLWAGPWNTTTPALPARAYSAFLDLGWQSDPNRPFGAELSGRLGVFTDFSRTERESFRPMGVALLRYNLTPTLAMKGGVSYINRADIKLLPAGGFLWTPNPQTRFDIFFPQPKLASYLTTLGTRELWWYIGGEYGGGVWTVTTESPDPYNKFTLMDINDIRLTLGLEVGQPGTPGVGQKGMFIEVGYVFDRQLVFVAYPDKNQSLKETFMLRGGITF